MCKVGFLFRFCGVYADDRRFFGLVTSQMRGGEESDSSCSCHVFMVEPINSQVCKDSPSLLIILQNAPLPV